MTADEYGVSLWADENVLKLDYGYGCPIRQYFKSHWVAQFKPLNYKACELYLNKDVIQA